MSPGPESLFVEQPFIDQLVGMGWKHTTGNLDHPSASGRESFAQVLILDDLQDAIHRTNLNDQGQPWLDDGRINQAISRLQQLGSQKLMEANQEATELLLSGTPVEGPPDWDGGRARTLHYLDWEHPERNTFRVVNQLRVDEPGGQAHRFIVPDLVLFVNGIPLAVVECKSPAVPEPIEQAIGQLQRYSNQRHWLDGNEGNERLFQYNQFMVATSFDEARTGTVGASAVHYREWKDTSPVPMSEVAEELGRSTLSSQEMLVAGMLRPAHILDYVRNFTLFAQSGAKTIKIAGRYQQFRAVQLAVQRLLTGETRTQHGEHDQRGGIIWHTQGSGKSLSMVFLVRKMRTIPELRRFKVVVVTDRRGLQDQLSTTAHLTGETVKVARSVAHLKELLAERGPGLVFAMIQKYNERDAYEDQEVEQGEGIRDSRSDVGDFPVLNEDDSILVMVDEAHRSQASALHANLMRSLPNCAKIGFTGTPIIMGAKKRSHEIFGDFIDKYLIAQSEADGMTVPILYEGRTAEGAVSGERDLDEVFEDMFRERTPEELERIKQKYATRGDVLEAKQLIEAKARDMLRHYVENILPNGFKAQLVAVSRRATIRYREALMAARDELVAELEGLDPELIGLSYEEIAEYPRRTQFLARVHRHLDTIQELEFAPVISGAHNDPPEWAEWTEKAKIDQRIARFKKPLFHKDPDRRDPLVFLIVKSMFLTGFDTPVEQALYLDRHIHQHELLQAIARVNRTYAKKTAGMVVDYYGVAQHLKEALDAYADSDVEGALRSIKDELPKLRDQHIRVMAFFEGHGIEDIGDIEACVELLEDEKLRAEFHVDLKRFLTTLDVIMPRPEVLPHIKDAKALSFIQARARNRYRGDERLIGGEVGDKVRKLIDDHIISLGIDPKIPPISITAAEFDRHVDGEGSQRAKASEMEHAARYYIRKHFDQDPEYYEKLSERLEKILKEFEDRWDELVDVLKDFVHETQAGRKQDKSGLDPTTQAPFLGILKRELETDGELPREKLVALIPVTLEIVDHVRQEIGRVGFWGNAHAQDVLRKDIVRILDDHDVVQWERLPEVADRMVGLARVNHEKLAE